MKLRIIAGSGVVLVAALAAWMIATRQPQVLTARAPEDRPPLALLTSLPLLFGENFGLEQTGSPALERLEQRYRVEAISVADASSLAGRQLLLLAHPRAQPAEALVALDAWVNRGGRVLLLADPRLEWPSERALGDLLRPPPAFADTGLLGHWGMSLSGPDRLGGIIIEVDGLAVASSAPGRLTSESCRVEAGGFLARCQIGRGRVTVVADADFLNVGPEGGQQGLDLLLRELTLLESR